MAILGAHKSIAGGYYKAVESAAAGGCDCVQLFTKNNNQWRAKPLTTVDAERFQTALRSGGSPTPLPTIAISSTWPPRTRPCGARASRPSFWR